MARRRVQLLHFIRDMSVRVLLMVFTCTLVAVNVDKERAAAEKFLVVNPASFTIAFDPAGKTAEAFHVSAMPSSYLIARDGRILFQHQGFDPKKTVDLETRIAEECSR